MTLGVLLLYVAVKGRSDPFLTAIGLPTIQQSETNIAKGLTKWATDNIWNPLGEQLKKFTINIKFGG